MPWVFVNAEPLELRVERNLCYVHQEPGALEYS